jgi:small subunit ribosomal protein S20
MPVKKASFKDLRKSKKKALKNTKVKSDIDALTRRIRKAVGQKDKTKAQEWLKAMIKKVDKAVQHSVIKKNTAARNKSRLTKFVNSLK